MLTAKYFATDVNHWEQVYQLYPDYLAPRDPRVILQWFEGSPADRIPWDAWLPFVAWWGSFSLLMVAAMMAIAGFFRRQWAESERLTYPMIFLPLEITGGFEGSVVRQRLLPQPADVGRLLGLAALFNGWHILPRFLPVRARSHDLHRPRHPAGRIRPGGGCGR